MINLHAGRYKRGTCLPLTPCRIRLLFPFHIFSVGIALVYTQGITMELPEMFWLCVFLFKRILIIVHQNIIITLRAYIFKQLLWKYWNYGRLISDLKFSWIAIHNIFKHNAWICEPSPIVRTWRGIFCCGVVKRKLVSVTFTPHLRLRNIYRVHHVVHQSWLVHV